MVASSGAKQGRRVLAFSKGLLGGTLLDTSAKRTFQNTKSFLERAFLIAE
jgi:hypothetical protein